AGPGRVPRRPELLHARVLVRRRGAPRVLRPPAARTPACCLLRNAAPPRAYGHGPSLRADCHVAVGREGAGAPEDRPAARSPDARCGYADGSLDQPALRCRRRHDQRRSPQAQADERELVLRRIVLQLDLPTRDGDTEMAILTNLPSDVADAPTIADLYRRRWTIESLFARVERNLQSEIATLAYPGAALFAFAVALVASNVFAVVHAAMTAAQKAHEDPKVAEMPLSDF